MKLLTPEAGDRVFVALTPREKAAMRVNLRVARDDLDGDDDWHCCLGNLGYANPVPEGVRVTNEHVRAMCRRLVEMSELIPGGPKFLATLDVVLDRLGRRLGTPVQRPPAAPPSGGGPGMRSAAETAVSSSSVARSPQPAERSAAEKT